MKSQHEFAQAVDAILGAAPPQSSLDLLDRIIGRGDASHLLSEIFSRISSAQSSPIAGDHVVSQTMVKLESLAEISPVIACTLMAHLWSIASDRRMHDICDAVCLWIAACNSHKLISHLKLIALAERDPDKRRHYEAMAEQGCA